FIVRDSGLPDPVVPDAKQHEISELPDELLVNLLGSRYCDTDLMADTAWSLFKDTPPGWPRVQAICDYVHNRLVFGYGYARPARLPPTLARARPAPPPKAHWGGAACPPPSPPSPSPSAAA